MRLSDKIIHFTLIILMCFNCDGYSLVTLVNDTYLPKTRDCGISKQGTLFGEATMFQDSWVHGKTGACGFEKPFSALAEGFFTAVGTEDWDEGFACGTCVELGYNGKKVIVNVVDRCGACTFGWFDLGGPAWTALTGELPGHVRGVTSRWVECPRTFTDGQNIHIYVKPGSHAWDARFQPVLNEMPVTGMFLDAGSGWMEMKNCENFMFCKPVDIVLGNNFRLRVSSVNKNIDVQVEGMPDGQYIDTGTNNGGAQCSSLSTALASALTTGDSESLQVDLEDHCTDVSFYDVVKYTTTPKQCCETTLKQVCTFKSDTICEDVLELKCDVVAWSDCKSEATTHVGTTCAVDMKDYDYQDCKQVKTSTKHTKQVPDCKKVTKNNCVTDWEINANGDKVWAGSETCTPVTWEECEIIEKEVEFPSIETECEVVAQIKWADYEDRKTDIIGMETTCEVKSAVDCKDVLVNKCSNAKWQECKMEPVEECQPVLVHMPDQEKIHKKKCLTD